MKKTLTLLPLASLLISCDPAITYSYVIDNRSDKALVFRYAHGYANARDSVTICPPHQKMTIEDIIIRGARPHDEGDDFLYPFRKLDIKTVDSAIVLKDFSKRKNWRYSNKIEHFAYYYEKV